MYIVEAYEVIAVYIRMLGAHPERPVRVNTTVPGHEPACTRLHGDKGSYKQREAKVQCHVMIINVAVKC